MWFRECVATFAFFIQKPESSTQRKEGSVILSLTITKEFSFETSKRSLIRAHNQEKLRQQLQDGATLLGKKP